MGFGRAIARPIKRRSVYDDPDYKPRWPYYEHAGISTTGLTLPTLGKFGFLTDPPYGVKMATGFATHVRVRTLPDLVSLELLQPRAGVALLIVGVREIYEPLGWVVGGLLIRSARRRERDQSLMGVISRALGRFVPRLQSDSSGSPYVFRTLEGFTLIENKLGRFRRPGDAAIVDRAGLSLRLLPGAG